MRGTPGEARREVWIGSATRNWSDVCNQSKAVYCSVERHTSARQDSRIISPLLPTPVQKCVFRLLAIRRLAVRPCLESAKWANHSRSIWLRFLAESDISSSDASGVRLAYDKAQACNPLWQRTRNEKICGLS